MRKLVSVAAAAAAVGVVGAGITSSFAATKSVRGTKDDRWSPSALTVKAGDKIRFVWNNTGAPHNVRKSSGSGGSLTKNKVSNKGSATFSVPSSAKKGARYRFVCDVHLSTMKLTATVR